MEHQINLKALVVLWMRSNLIMYIMHPDLFLILVSMISWSYIHRQLSMKKENILNFFLYFFRDAACIIKLKKDPSKATKNAYTKCEKGVTALMRTIYTMAKQHISTRTDCSNGDANSKCKCR